jgi:hypothetical protein
MFAFQRQHFRSGGCLFNTSYGLQGFPEVALLSIIYGRIPIGFDGQA